LHRNRNRELAVPSHLSFTPSLRGCRCRRSPPLPLFPALPVSGGFLGLGTSPCWLLPLPTPALARCGRVTAQHHQPATPTTEIKPEYQTSACAHTRALPLLCFSYVGGGGWSGLGHGRRCLPGRRAAPHFSIGGPRSARGWRPPPCRVSRGHQYHYHRRVGVLRSDDSCTINALV
jgi:hypothetical protein